MEDCNNHLNETQEQLNTFFIKFEGLGEEQSTTNAKKTLQKKINAQWGVVNSFQALPL
jgi:superoxide dismutase